MNQNDVVLPPGQSRREFVKVFAQIGAYVSLCAPVGRFFVGEASAQTAGLTGIFNASLSVAPFTALQQLNGSVRVEVPNGTGITELTALPGIPNPAPPPSVIITRVATSGSSQFGTLGQRCTHAGNAVATLVAGQTTLVCPLHGSQFNPSTGAVVAGPALTALTPYLTVFTATPAPGTIQIRIAGIGYTFVANTVTSLQGPRVRLQFPSKVGTNYEVRFRSTVTGTQSVLTFATVQNNPATLTVIAGTGAVLTVFVNAPAQVGFYVIAAKE